MGPGIIFSKPLFEYGLFWRVLFFIFLWTVPLLTAAHGAEPAAHSDYGEGIAMHGHAKYDAAFKHFDYVNPAAPKGGVLRLGALGSFDGLNPYIIKGTPPRAEQYNVYVFESLMYRAADEPFSIYPWLAKRAHMASDRSSITFTLNPRARWHDGKPVTVDDVLFTVETLKTKGRPSHRAYYSKVSEVAKVGHDSIKFTLKKQPDGSYDQELPLIIGLMPILPKHFWADKDFAATSLEPPLGSGAYRVSQVDAGRKIVLTRVNNYWAEDVPALKGQQNFGSIVIDYFRDEGIAREALLAGRTDLRFETDPLKMRAAYKGPAVSRGDIVLESVPHKRPEPYKGIIFNTRRPLFADPVLRQALQLGGDFSAINTMLFGGAYKRSLSAFPNSVLAAPGAEQYMGVAADARKNLRKAQQMLEAAGYYYKDGQLHTPAAQPVVFEVILSEPADERVVLSWRESIKPLGVKVMLRTIDSAQFQARLNDFDYDAIVFRWINTLSPGNEQLVYWGSKAADTKGSRNYAGIKDDAVDKLANRLLAAKTYADLQETAQALDARLIQGAYAVPFFYLGADLVARWRHIQCPATVPITGFEMRSCWHRP